ncbi:uncharacterized protein LOC122314956 [Carya illinoinensis]|uniref:Ternary complex factor MIP1 leucine-zipper domain-containing protein n=1 Tax=Carya illinoinensis TaxID=32201 RepID=A0A8T1PVE3_CARIL|nr:uncharacterized protein LOC122314956 [Carya illinoinensis]KAG6648509.1 hypothetical protein CIPAW_07G152400 [Carya illinoinensis]
MGFEESRDIKLLGLRVSPKHRRSKSFPDKRRVEEDGIDSSLKASERIKLDLGHLKNIKTKKKQSGKAEVNNSLRQEILQLEKGLKYQFEVRHALEKALGYSSSSHEKITEILMPKVIYILQTRKALCVCL